MSARTLPPTVSQLTDDGWLSPHFGQLQARADRARAMAGRLTGGKLSLWDWARGHEWFGLHREADGSWVYRDWAPNADGLVLVGDFSDWKEKDAFRAHRLDAPGQWEVSMPAEALKHGQHYRVRIGWPGGCGDRLPAWGRRMWQDASTLIYTAQVWEPEPYAWKNEAPPASAFPKVYEAHVGMALEQARLGSWAEFRDGRLEKIKEAGYDTIQLMAVMEHPYYGSFGYHVGSFFAPSSRFGTAEELKSLIDAAHGLGLRVIMDIVHSHAVKNEVEGLSRYDGTLHQFFHDGPRGMHTAWDSRCFDYGKPEVVHFLLSNVRYWLEEFRFDGFRYDGVTSMLYHDHGLGSGFSSYGDYFGANVDEEAVTYLTLANWLAQEGRPDAVSVAEDVSGMPGLGAPMEVGGLGFDFRLSMGMPDCWFKLAADIRDEDWSMNWLWHELTNHRPDERAISYVESHDQALVGGKSFIFQLIDAAMYDSMHVGSKNLLVDRGVALHKMARLATMAAAGNGYLTFMGNEFGHPEWVDFPREGNGWSYAKARRLWSLRDDPNLRFRALGDFDQAMLALPEPIWATSPPQLIKADDGDKLLAFSRGKYVFAFNFHPEKSFTGYGLTVPRGQYLLLLCTDEGLFGGFDRVPVGQAFPTQSVAEGEWVQLYLPARTAMVLERL